MRIAWGEAMGDLSAEPSMEDILSSIKRIIAEEGDGAASAGKARRAARAAGRPEPQPFENDQAAEQDHVAEQDEVLELSHPVQPVEAAAEPVPNVAPAPAPSPAAVDRAPVDPILSPRAAEASRGALDQLSRLVVKPEVNGSDTLEGLVREMVRPMLREWLDAKLPGMVEEMVAREIARIAGQG